MGMVQGDCRDTINAINMIESYHFTTLSSIHESLVGVGVRYTSTQSHKEAQNKQQLDHKHPHLLPEQE
jgi:hypothetical protein